MRQKFIVALAVASIMLATGRALANGSDFVDAECYETVVSPGETVRAGCVLSNDTDQPMKFRVKARIQGDRDALRGKAGRTRGKRVKLTVRVAPGQTVIQEMDLPVPRKANGPVVAEFKVKGPNGKRVIRQSLFAMAEATVPHEFAGMITFDDEDLAFHAQGGETVHLVGHQAEQIRSRMMASGDSSIGATIHGFDLADMPLRLRERMLSHAESPFFMLGVETEDLGAESAGVVAYRPVASGVHSTRTGMGTMVARTEGEWHALMDHAGIDPDSPLVDDHTGFMSQAMMMDGDDDHDEAGFFHGMLDIDHHDDEADEHGPFENHADDDHDHGMVLHDSMDQDFERHMLVAIFAGDQPTDGFHVEMRGVTRDPDGGFTCHYEIMGPDESEHVIQQMTQPFVVIAMPRTDMPIRFVAQEN